MKPLGRRHDHHLYDRARLTRGRENQAAADEVRSALHEVEHIELPEEMLASPIGCECAPCKEARRGKP